MAGLEPFLAWMEGPQEAFVAGAIRRVLMELVAGKEVGAIAIEDLERAKSIEVGRGQGRELLTGEA